MNVFETNFLLYFSVFFSSFDQYGKALVRSYVESSEFITWCRNPTGCDYILCRDDGYKNVTCGQCGWSSCLSCTFTEVSQLSHFIIGLLTKQSVVIVKIMYIHRSDNLLFIGTSAFVM